MANTPTIIPIVSDPFQENSYLAFFEESEECLIFDPGLEPKKILAEVDSRNLQPVAIICTHGHSDHIAGNAAMKERWPECPLIIGKGDEEKLTDPVGNLSALFQGEVISPLADQTVVEGEVLELAGFRLEIRETPGHSTGHIVLVALDLDPIHVFSGDMLFYGGIGRTDFPGGSFEVLRQSIVEKLYTLPDETVLLTGHGPTTTVGREKRSNPYVGLGS